MVFVMLSVILGPGFLMLSLLHFQEGSLILGWALGIVAGILLLPIGLVLVWMFGHVSSLGVRRVLAKLLMGQHRQALERLLGVVVSRHFPDLLGHADRQLRLADGRLHAWSAGCDERPVSAEMRSEIARLFEARLGWRGRLLMRVKARHRVVFPESNHAALQTWARLNSGRCALVLHAFPPAL